MTTPPDAGAPGEPTPGSPENQELAAAVDAIFTESAEESVSDLMTNLATRSGEQSAAENPPGAASDADSDAVAIADALADALDDVLADAEPLQDPARPITHLVKPTVAGGIVLVLDATYVEFLFRLCDGTARCLENGEVLMLRPDEMPQAGEHAAVTDPTDGFVEIAASMAQVNILHLSAGLLRDGGGAELPPHQGLLLMQAAALVRMFLSCHDIRMLTPHVDADAGPALQAVALDMTAILQMEIMSLLD